MREAPEAQGINQDDHMLQIEVKISAQTSEMLAYYLQVYTVLTRSGCIATWNLYNLYLDQLGRVCLCMLHAEIHVGFGTASHTCMAAWV